MELFTGPELQLQYEIFLGIVCGLVIVLGLRGI
jgi:hypothetical protein